jgi:malate synthase
MESALSTIIDCEDSVAAGRRRRQGAGLSQLARPDEGHLTERSSKGGKTFTRKPQRRPRLHRADGGKLVLHGRSLMLVRNVGHLMTNPAILDSRRATRSPKASWMRWSPC